MFKGPRHNWFAFLLVIENLKRVFAVVLATSAVSNEDILIGLFGLNMELILRAADKEGSMVDNFWRSNANLALGGRDARRAASSRLYY